MNPEQALTREPCWRRDVQGHLREIEHELAGVQQSTEAVGSELRAVQRELNHAKQVRYVIQLSHARSCMLAYRWHLADVQCSHAARSLRILALTSAGCGPHAQGKVRCKALRSNPEGPGMLTQQTPMLTVTVLQVLSRRVSIARSLQRSI